MQYVYEMLKKIFVLSVVSEIINNILPNEKYRPYVKLIKGLCIVLVFFNLLPQVINSGINALNKKYNYNKYEKKSISYDYMEIEDERYMLEYENANKEYISKIVMANACVLQYIELDINKDINSEDFGKINKISMKINSNKKQSDDDRYISVSNISKKIIKEYGIDGKNLEIEYLHEKV